MKIPKLNRESHAFFVVQRLPSAHKKLTWLVTQLRNTARTFTTVELIGEQNGHKNMYNYVKDFWAVDETWFTSVFPDWAAVIPGYISSMENINAAIVTGLQSNYWDAELNAPVIIEISQAHRNALADVIEGELD
jgi:hypothetical protein